MSSSAEASAGAPAHSPEAESELGYALWAVLRRDPATPVVSTADLSAAVAAVESVGVTIRGWYDVSSL
jgi:hypothetical protein